MARLQILELPEGAGDDRPPFVLVVDECAPQRYVIGLDASWQDHWQVLADKIGARGVIVTPDTIDIPANDTSAFAQPLATALHLDDHEVRGAIAADMNKARQQAGVATIGQHLADERTDIARDMDRLAGHKTAMINALGIDQLNGWDDIHRAATDIRRERDAKTDAIESIRNLHRAVEHRGQIICWECSDYDFRATPRHPRRHRNTQRLK